ncbi:MAG: glycosyltransferase [Quinella sp. 1Q7]|nr:glycosyltransferase [Quinella sp. 1Q7]
MAKRKAKKIDRIKISACYIVKNCAEDLRRSLKSLVGQADEIIVVDTGSTDDTVAVAEKFGAKIFHKPWQDDFATPRNIALRAATGDWIVFLDADEFFVNGTAKNLRTAIKNAKRNNLGGLFVNMVTVDADNDFKPVETSCLLRVFANVPGIHYVGKVHETIYLGDEIFTNVAMVPADMLTLWHTGYSTKIIRSKLERNLKLLLEELATTDKPERVYAYLADCYYGLGDMVNAEKFARLHVDTIASVSTRALRILIDILSKDSARVDEYIACLRRAVAVYPYVPEFSGKLAEALAGRGEYREAVDEMKRAIVKAENYGEQYESTTFDAAAIVWARDKIAAWSNRISACYIVKDCAEDLRRSLKTLAQFVDEIIVVDTGSTDDTVAVAEEFGAKIFHEPWQDDFAAARNVALSKATGSWIVFLDADEFFIDGTAKNLRAAIEPAKRKNLRGIFVKLVNVDTDNDCRVISTVNLLRIFANVPGIHYVGKIHEELFCGDEFLTGLTIAPADMMTLWHTGYAKSVIKSKLERNLAPLLEELETSDKPERVYHFLAKTYFGLEDFANAEKFARLDIAREDNPLTDSMRTLINVLARDDSRADELFDCLRDAVARYPKVPEFSAMLAEKLATRGKYREAVDEMQRAFDKAANYGEQYEFSIFDEDAQKSARAAIDDWSTKIQLTPDEKRREVSRLTDELIQIRELFHNKERLLWVAKKLFSLKPDTPAPIEKVASLYIDYKMADEAETVMSWLEENFPPSAYRLMLRARTFRLRENMQACIDVAERALKLDGDLITTMLIHNLLGQSYRAVGKIRQAIDNYTLNATRDISSLQGTPQYAQAENIRREEYDNMLFNMHDLNYSREELFRAAQGFNKLLAHLPRFKHNRRLHARHKKIRVGYISPDIRFHVVAFFSSNFFTNYDKTRFEVYVYAKNVADNVTKQFAAAVDNFRDILDKTSAEVAKRIVDDEIDILVDLAGHTANNSLDVLAYKPAPIQISGIGYMSTTGLDTVDYFLADKFTDPEGLNEKFFTEKILRLQHSHFCYTWHDFPHMVAPAPCSKNGFVTFGSFNNFGKVTDEMLALWAKILDGVPNSRLYLKAAIFQEGYGGDGARERIKAAGIDLNRVTCESSAVEYVKCYEQMDIALDTFPYPGGGTTCDALYMGVPVITLVGERHNSRFGYSLLMNIGLEELCAFSTDEYVQKAIELANDLERLRDYHLTIRRRMEDSPVMNDMIYMGELEQAYEKIFDAWTNNQPLPDFPQELPPLTDALAKRFYRRAMDYVKLETAAGKSKYHRVDFKRTIYYGELAAQREVTRDANLLVAIADRRFNVDDNIGSYEWMRRAVDFLYTPQGQTEKHSGDFMAECHSKLARYSQANGHHFEAIKNYERAFELTDDFMRKLEFYDAVLLGLHFLDISSEELAAPHFDYQNFFDGVKQFTTYHKRHKRIRVGYIGGDFRNHATFSVVFGFMSCHDRSKFEVTCYSRNKEDDDFTEFYRRGVEHFVDVRGLSAEELAKKIHDDEIDIAVDLAGHTGYNGLPALAYKPAPIQMCGIGYMSTTGLKAIDYMITDAVLDPPGEHEKFFSEKFLYMPAQFSYARREDLPASEGASCIKNGYVTFGTICRYMKINDDMLAVWTEILRRVPTAKLLLRAQEFISNRTQTELYDTLKRLGCDMDRVIIRPAVHDYFRAISEVDIILDAYPYVGGATTLDALYMGVPVVTLYGERHSTRFAKSILVSVGLGELATDSIDAYINTAVALANDHETLDLLHKNLRGMFLQSDALDPMKYCRTLEQKFTELLDAKGYADEKI